jgi:hypothetical protein
MKKGSVFLLLAMVVMIPFVSAGPIEIVTDVVTSTINAALAVFGPIFDKIMGDNNAQGDVVFAKFLFLILLTVIINLVLQRIPIFKGRAGLGLIIALIVSILAVRFMTTSNVLQGVLLPYGALGIAITMGLPFILFFYFIHTMGVTGFMRRLLWIFYAVIFLVLWAYRYSDIDDVSNTIFTLIFIAISIAFIFDKSIKRYFGTHEIGKFKANMNNKVIAALQSEYYNILHVDTPQAHQRREYIERKLRQLGGGNLP